MVRLYVAEVTIYTIAEVTILVWRYNLGNIFCVVQQIHVRKLDSDTNFIPKNCYTQRNKLMAPDFLK